MITVLLLKFWSFIKTHWKMSLIVLLAITVLLFIITSKACKKEPTIDQESIQKINNAQEDRRKEELKAVIEKNADVIKSDAEDTALVNLDVAKRNEEINKKVEELDKKVQETKQQGHDVTSEELQCLLVPTDCS